MMRRAIGGLFLAFALGAGWAPGAWAGAYIFAGEDFGTNLIAHPRGWTTSTRGEIEVRVCIVPGTPNSGVMVKSVQNIVDRFNLGVATVGNVRLGSDNDINSSEIDFESTAAHEVGHCLGLAHSNLATESGEIGEDQDYTKSTDGNDNIFNLAVGPDGVRGSPDDARGDDVNLHWFEVDVNDPFDVSESVDESNYSLATADLPPGDSFAVNGSRDVSLLFGYPLTEAVMQQGAFFDEDQRALSADDVATLQFARNGRDRRTGTSDDYSVQLVYGGISGSSTCDINLAFDDAETGFAVCQTEASVVEDDYARFVSSNTFYNNSFNWHFSSRRIPYPAADFIEVSKLTSISQLSNGDTSLLANDVDQSSPRRGLIVSTLPSRPPLHGLVELNPDGTFTYTNTDDEATHDQFQYRVCVDNTSPAETTCAHQNVGIIIIDNGPPEAADDQLTLSEGGAGDTLDSGSPSLLANDSDPEGSESLLVSTTPVVLPTTGTVTLIEDGTFLYVHDGSEQFSDAFSYEVCDEFGLCDIGAVTVMISEVNDLPITTDDNLAPILEDSETLGLEATLLLGNDSAGTDESAQTLMLTATANPVGGAVQWDGQVVRFTPTPDYFGPAGFTYSVQDDGTTDGAFDPQSATGSVSFAVVEVNDPPIAADDQLPTLDEDSPSSVIPFALLTQNDEAGPPSESNQAFSVSSLDTAVGGQATLTAQGIEFVSDADFNGIASFQYTLIDNGTTAGVSDPLSDTATAFIPIGEINDPPAPGSDVLDNVPEGSGALDIAISELLANDQPGPPDEIAQALTIVALGNATGGQVAITDDRVVFSIDDEYSGVAAFTYTVEDDGTSNGQPDPKRANAEVSILVVGQNDPPLADDDIVGDQSSGDSVALDTTILLANDVPGPSAEADQLLTVTDVFAATGGTATLSGGVVFFDVDEGFVGEASFNYQIQDNGTTNNIADFKEATARVSFTVFADNLPPLARTDTLAVVWGASATTLSSGATRLTDNDIDPNGDDLQLSAVAASPPSFGTVHLNVDGTFVYEHGGAPQALDKFAYEVCDTNSTGPRCSVGEVIVVVSEGALESCSSSAYAATVGVPVVVPYIQSFPALPLEFDAEGLPPSLSLDLASGVVSGTPVLSDVSNLPYEVVITGTSVSGAQFHRSLALLVSEEPELTFYSGFEQSCGI